VTSQPGPRSSLDRCRPERLSKYWLTSPFQYRLTRYPRLCKYAVLILSAVAFSGSACWLPSNSTTTFFSKQTKSTTNGPIGCWRRNLNRAKRRLRKADHSFRSTLVCSRLSRLASLCFRDPLTLERRSRCSRFLDLSRKGRGKAERAYRTPHATAFSDRSPARRSSHTVQAVDRSTRSRTKKEGGRKAALNLLERELLIEARDWASRRRARPAARGSGSVSYLRGTCRFRRPASVWSRSARRCR
jgi:hypothetical protein